MPVAGGRGRGPKVVLARSLDEASSGALVYVDRQGHVRSPTRYRVFQGMSYVGLGAIAALPVFYGLLFGPVGAVAGLGFVAFSALRIRPSLAVQRAVRLSAHGMYEEAEALLERVITSRLAPQATRAAAYQGLAVCRGMRGDYDSALRYVRYARERFPAVQSSVRFRMGSYLEVHLLVNLGRADEARQRLQAVGPVPEGEYLRVAHWTAEMYVWLGGDEGARALAGDARPALSLSDDEVHERARKALSMTAGSALLGLCAWVHTQRGDDDQAEHLLREAFDRMVDERIERMMPRLHAWMVAHQPAPQEEEW